ncbi:MAG TPA: ferrochelatase [Candidatus Limnocylindria bacterium]
MTTGVLLMTYGAPSGDADVGAYLARVRGHPPAPELVLEMRRRYRLIGGSPLIGITRAQGTELARVLGRDYRVRVGMRFSEPAIGDEVRALVSEEGAERIVAIPMSPQWSDRLMAGYERAVADASTVPFALARSWYRTPSFVVAIAGAVRESLARIGDASLAIVLTAHSLPRRVFEAEPAYVEELRETARIVAEAAGLVTWSFAYQSAGHTAEEWLRPDLVDLFPSLAALGATDVLVVPIQFLADHLEVLYDLDIAAAAQARVAGLRYHRVPMQNTRADFIEALATIVRALGDAGPRQVSLRDEGDPENREESGEDGPVHVHEDRGERSNQQDEDRRGVVLAGDKTRRDEERDPKRVGVSGETREHDRVGRQGDRFTQAADEKGKRDRG